MAVLVINEDVQASLERLAEHANNNRYSFDELLDIKNKALDAPGLDPNFFCMVPIGYKVVFTVEEQPGAQGGEMINMRHMSMSTSAKGKLPNPITVQEIMGILGFEGKLADCYVHTMEDDCITVLELIEKI